MSLNDDYFDVINVLNRRRKNKEATVSSFKRLIKRLDDLEEENENLRNTYRGVKQQTFQKEINEMHNRFPNDYSKLDFSTTREIVLHKEEFLGLDIELVAMFYGQVELYIRDGNGNPVKQQDYHFDDWGLLGTNEIIRVWKDKIISGDVWY